MDIFRTKYITLLTSFTLISSAGIGALLYYCFPDWYPLWYYQIVLFLFIIEFAVVCIVDTGSKKLDQRKLVNLYMSIKVAKVLLSLAFVGIYALVVKENIKSFVLIFMVFYCLYIIFETYYLSNVERRIKETNKT